MNRVAAIHIGDRSVRACEVLLRSSGPTPEDVEFADGISGSSARKGRLFAVAFIVRGHRDNGDPVAQIPLSSTTDLALTSASCTDGSGAATKRGAPVRLIVDASHNPD